MNAFFLSFALCFLQVLCTQNGAGPAKLKNLHKPMMDPSSMVIPMPVFTPVQSYPVQQYPQTQYPVQQYPQMQYPVQQYPQVQLYPGYQYVPAQPYPFQHQQHHHRPHYNQFYPQYGHGYPC